MMTSIKADIQNLQYARQNSGNFTYGDSFNPPNSSSRVLALYPFYRRGTLGKDFVMWYGHTAGKWWGQNSQPSVWLKSLLSTSMLCYVYTSGSQSVVPRPETSASPGNFGEIHIFWPTPHLPNKKLWGWVLVILLNKSCRWFWCANVYEALV